MNDILEEIKADLKAERLAKLISKYGKAILFGSLVIISTAAIYSYIRYSHIAKQEKISVDYHKAIISGNIDTFINSNKNNSYAHVAALREIDDKINKQKIEEALSSLVTLIENCKEQDILILAKIRYAQTTLAFKRSHYYKTAIGYLEKSISKNVLMEHLMKFISAQLNTEMHENDRAKNILLELTNDVNTPNNIKFFANLLLQSS